MARALESEGRFQTASHHEACVGLGAVSLGSNGPARQVTWNQDQTVGLVMEGEIFDVAALEASLADGQERPRGTSPAELALRLYERCGEEFAARLNGAFAVAVWDRREGKLVVVNDRQGMLPLYYAQVNGALLFASGVRALLADPGLDRSVDEVAINQFLVFDHMLGDRTLLNSVRLLPQASVLTFRDDRLTIRPYWTLRYPDRYEPQREGAYVEQFVHYLRQAVARQKPDDRSAGVLLSGGLDSRLLVGVLAELGCDVETLTFGIPGCDDARIAAEVAAALGTRHRFMELKSDWLADLAEEAVRITDGQGNVVNLHTLAPLASSSGYAQVLYKGFMGDALLGYALKRQMWGDYDGESRYEVHLAAHRSQGVVNYERSEQADLFTDAFQARVGDAVCRAYREGMDRSGVSQLANQRLYFDLTQRVPRMTLNGVDVARSRAVVRLPFCDNDMIDWVLTVPPGFLFERHLPEAALSQYFPRLAQIPLENTGRPLRLCARDVRVQIRTLLSWHMRQAGLGWLTPRVGRPYKDYDGWFRTRLRPWVEDILLSPRALGRGYFKPEYVRRLVAEQVAGARHAVRIGALLTLELWHRQFLD